MDEVERAVLVLVKIVQEISFNQEISAIKNQTEIKNKTVLRLNPFIDSKGVLRVGGRIQLSNVQIHKKHQILLPANHHFTWLLFQSEHIRLLHPGPQMLLSSIRSQYWVINGRNLARKFLLNV